MSSAAFYMRDFAIRLFTDADSVWRTTDSTFKPTIRRLIDEAIARGAYDFTNLRGAMLQFADALENSAKYWRREATRLVDFDNA